MDGLEDGRRSGSMKKIRKKEGRQKKIRRQKKEAGARRLETITGEKGYSVGRVRVSQPIT